MEKAKNIAIFGGAFNPIHKGHINLINEFDKIFRFDKILLIPTKTPPHKSKDEFVSDEHRMNMLKLVNKDYPKLTPCDI
ncbi:MAG: adenylyltransferase/cytidyltransferase family protein, partial [Oscillospiraceae bacterium]|nr:adenylyltransferase/cytidyltransferase family protein [Oscillospiraceae bacterium]